MVKSRRDLNLKVDRQRNIKQFDQTIYYTYMVKMIISITTINENMGIRQIIKINQAFL